VKVLGIDPGSARTGYGCVETHGTRHRLVICGAVSTRGALSLVDRLLTIHREITRLIDECRPEWVAVENVFAAVNTRSALTLGHVRGVAMLAAAEAGVQVAEYTPSEVKRAVVGYGRAEKHQVQQMVKLLLDLPAVPAPHDVADALAVAICHVNRLGPAGRAPAAAAGSGPSWRRLKL
jgi:crossover junction endodeoxyribonuclease RuvC